MPDAKLLTPAPWKNLTVKFKIKDSDLQKALADFDQTEEDEHEELLDCLKEIKECALELKKSKEVSAAQPVAKYLADLLAACEAEHKDVTKDKEQSKKDEEAARKKEEAEAKKKEKEEEEDEDQDEDEDEDEEDTEGALYHEQLHTGFKRCKGSKEVPYQFIVCDAKPHPALMIAKRITTKHKTTLIKITNSKRFLHVGTVGFEGGKYVFTLPKEVAGLARQLQD